MVECKILNFCKIFVKILDGGGSKWQEMVESGNNRIDAMG